MRVQELNREKLSEFLSYCEKYGKDHDETYLPDKTFIATEDNPTYILLNENNKIVGAASIIMTPSFLDINASRFRIFHSVINDVNAYELLFHSIQKHFEPIEKVYLLLPASKYKTGELLIKLGFQISRYVYYLERSNKALVQSYFPSNMQLRAIRENIDETVWCDIVNECFSYVDDHEDLVPDEVQDMQKNEELMKDGMMILWDGDKAIGTVCVSMEEINGKSFASIGCVAILPEYRRNNLGRNLIRAAIEFAAKNGFYNSSLTVDTKNIDYVNLYLREGFEAKDITVYYQKYT